MDNWVLVSKVLRSKYRKEILMELNKKPAIPSILAKKLGLSRPNISNSLKELEEWDLIQCLTPNEKRGRLYRITKKGKEIINHI